MPLVPTHARLKLLHVCDQWHSSQVSTPLLLFGTVNTCCCFTVNHVEILKANPLAAPSIDTDLHEGGGGSAQINPRTVAALALAAATPHPRLRLNISQLARMKQVAATDPIAQGMLKSLENAGKVLVLEQTFAAPLAFGSHDCWG
jgi:hypothetical protein